ncbi:MULTISPECIES: SRPBCC family protein [unclassified Streptomyces]|uniref:SRPBCC family protein n=1 Tax=unclassified Streptomyces TaxID=2593676 RepID=UPI000DB9754A|nr:SRPBCC family protein [Streptomyces sp. PsTaAH-137]MYT68182.1 cyclase [Streptomyces sp. SID8367]RAJ72751.1 polyketide cyclase/dehydrase/lipid transport protein [Streptomyces sp. PsTaAH-137]
MADSTFTQIKKSVADNPATDQLKKELVDYVEAQAQHTVSSLGHKLGETAARLGEGSGSGGLMKSLAKGGQALSKGKSPAQAALAAGTSHAKDAVTDKVKSLFGKGRKSGGGKSKSVLISEDIDVGVPVREAYDQWTQFQEFSTFAKGVVNVEKADDTTSNWTVKVAKSTRSWKANVTEQIPDERISWTTEGAKGTVKGVVTFHRINDRLTRVLLVLEYFPKGLFEKTGNIWRAQGRRARLDLKLYRKFIMMRGEATDGWRGEIRDGEVVVDHEQALADEESDEPDSADDTYEDDAHDDEEYDEDYEYDDTADDAYDEADNGEYDDTHAETLEDLADGEEDMDSHDYADDESSSAARRPVSGGERADRSGTRATAHGDQDRDDAPTRRRRAAAARR